MRIKKTKKTPAAARAAKKPSRASRSKIAARPAAVETPVPAIGAGPIVAAIACIVTFVGAIALVPTHETAPRTESVVNDAPPADTEAVQKPKAKPETPRAAAKDVQTAKDVKEARDAKKTSSPKAAADPVRNDPVEPVGALVADAAPVASSTEPLKTRPVDQVAAVTITGCLEQDDDAFWLKDTSGVDAPTSRSWRSGFLKKKPSRIELVDPNNALKLPAYVGRRIAATGTLVNREMQTRSLHPLGASCS